MDDQDEKPNYGPFMKTVMRAEHGQSSRTYYGQIHFRNWSVPDHFLVRRFGCTYTGSIKYKDVISQTPMSEAEYMHFLVDECDMKVRLHHFGTVYVGRIIQTAKTRALVQFTSPASGKTYERWKPVFTLQPPI